MAKRIMITLFAASVVLNVYFVLRSNDMLRIGHGRIFGSVTSKKTGNTDTKTAYNTPCVVYSVYEDVGDVAADSSTGPGLELPDSLFIPAGVYTFGGKNYNITRSGLYRFIFPGTRNEQRIVFSGDTDTLLSGIAWIVCHGNSDNGLPLNSLLKKAQQGKTILTCGTVSRHSDRILKKLGIRSRIVVGMTLDEWNSHGNGHTLIEVYREHEKKWVVYDLDHNCTFFRNGEPLSLFELSYLVRKGLNYDIHRIAADTRLAVNSFNDKSGYSYDLMAESVMASDSTLKRWYKRVLQVPLMNDGEKYYFFEENVVKSQRLLKYSKRYTPVSDGTEFINRFYAENRNKEGLLKVVTTGEFPTGNSN